MMTVQQVFDMAIHIVDEQSESTGATLTEDTDEYKFRTISILNSIIPALAPYSTGYESEPGQRPYGGLLYVFDNSNPDFIQWIPLDDTLCATLLPYYLAAKLMATENEALSTLCMNQYRESFNDLKNKVPAEFERIPTPYGLF